MTNSMVVGIFVGGQARRMGGRAKGMLPAPDTGEPLVLRLQRMVTEAFGNCEILLIGRHHDYERLNLPIIDDNPSNIGPLGGLIALLEHAIMNEANSAVALACDLPRVSAELLLRLASHAPAAAAVAPIAEERYQPFFARYEPTSVLPAARSAEAAGERSLQSVFERLGSRVVPLVLSSDELALLTDWDSPGDVFA
jgi:molybdopterin-guanine dinucleotide biosynthesis protein A